MRTASRLLALFIILSAFGCAPKTRVLLEKEKSAERVISRIQARVAAIKTLKGKGKITVEAPEASNTGSFTLDLKRPDSLRLQMNGPLGIRVATVSLTKERAVIYNWMENSAVISSDYDRGIEKTLNIDLQFEDIINLLIGNLLEVGGRDSLKGFSVQDETYTLKFSSAAGTRVCDVDASSFVATRCEAVNMGKLFIGTAEEIESIDDLDMPMMLRVVFPGENRSVTISYSRLSVNDSVTCSFTVPPQATIVYR